MSAGGSVEAFRSLRQRARAIGDELVARGDDWLFAQMAAISDAVGDDAARQRMMRQLVDEVVDAASAALRDRWTDNEHAQPMLGADRSN